MTVHKLQPGERILSLSFASYMRSTLTFQATPTYERQRYVQTNFELCRHYIRPKIVFLPYIKISMSIET